jgi:predicted NACHT family NTPase
MATVTQLVSIRSTLVEDVLAYLHELSTRTAKLPRYYPKRLRTGTVGGTSFDEVRQMVQVVEDREALEHWLAEERERLHRAGQSDERRAYKPRKARPELAEPDSDAEGDRDDEPDMPVSIPWDEHAGRRFRRAVILGDPGFGKSWLLQWETRRLALEGKRQLEQWKVSLDDLVLPILARCSELNQSDDAVEDALVRLAGQDRTEEFRRWVLWKLRNGGCVVLLDAWDEVPLEPRQQGAPSRHAPNYRERLGQRLGRFGEEFPDLRMLLSSRIVGYGGSPVTDLVEVELVAWETPQIESFVRVWFGPDGRKGSEFLDRLQRVGQVQGLARIPLMLALLCKAFERKRLSLPTTRGKLYNECLRGLLGDWKGEEDGAERVSPAYIDAVLEVLCPVGLELFSEGHDQFGVSLLRTKLLTRLDGVAPKSRTP